MLWKKNFIKKMPYNNHLIKPVSLTHKRAGIWIDDEDWQINDKCILMVGTKRNL